MTPIARKLEIINDQDWIRFEERRNKIDTERNRLETTYLKPMKRIIIGLDLLIQLRLAIELLYQLY